MLWGRGQTLWGRGHTLWGRERDAKRQKNRQGRDNYYRVEESTLWGREQTL